MKKLQLALTLLLFCFVTVLFSQTKKKILIEEATGTWCLWCPRGEVYAKAIANAFPEDVILVSVHGNDPMEHEPYNESAGFSFFPAAYIDRTHTSLAYPQNIDNDIQRRINHLPPAGIKVETSYDSLTRTLDAKIIASFDSTVTRNLRLGAIVIENGVTGPPPRYNQANGYFDGSNGEMGGYEMLPRYVPAGLMMYNQVARHLEGSFEGIPNSLPLQPQAGEQYSYEFSYVIPQDYDPNYMQVVGFLADESSGAILNAGKSPYPNGEINAKPFFQSSPWRYGFVGSPWQYQIITQDPDYDSLNLASALTIPSWANFEITSDGRGFLSGIPSEQGIFEFSLILSDGQHQVLQNFKLEIYPSEEGWYLLGEEGFGKDNLIKTILAEDSKGNLYLAGIHGDSREARVYKYEGNEWQLHAPILSLENASHVDFTISQDDKPLLFSSGKLLALEGGQWRQRGSNMPGLYFLYPSIDFDANGVLHIAVYQPEIGISTVYKLLGNSWQQIGGSLAPFAATFLQLKFDPQGIPHVLLGTGGGVSPFSQVVKLNAGRWESLGSGAITQEASTFYYHDLTFDKNGTPYVAITLDQDKQETHVYRWSRISWQRVGENLGNGRTAFCQIETDKNGDILVGFQDFQNLGRATVLKWEQNTWTAVGTPGFSSPGKYQHLLVNFENVPIVSQSNDATMASMSVRHFPGFRKSNVKRVVAQQNIWVYPNPISGIVNIQILESGILSLYDCQGRLVKERTEMKGAGGVLKLDLSNLVAGWYIVQVKTPKGCYSQKVFKQ